MTTTQNISAAQALANTTIAAQDALDIERTVAFDMTIAAMIAEDPEAMRELLAKAHTQYETEVANA